MRQIRLHIVLLSMHNSLNEVGLFEGGPTCGRGSLLRAGRNSKYSTTVVARFSAFNRSSRISFEP